MLRGGGGSRVDVDLFVGNGEEGRKEKGGGSALTVIN